MLRTLLVLTLLALAAGLTAQTTPVAPPPPEQAAVFSVWSQRMDMSLYAGKKYRLSVAIRAEPATPESFAVLLFPAEVSTRSAPAAFADIVTIFAVPLDTFPSA